MRARPMNERRKQLGDRAEDFVADYLITHGADIVARNLRLGMLEVDIVARIDRLVLVVEVRYRSRGSFTTPLSSMNPLKRTRLRRAGERLWNRRYRHDPSVDRIRFDVAAVRESDQGLQLEYIPGAF